MNITVSDEEGARMTGPSFMMRVHRWMLACFGAEISADRLERGDRLLEEVLELLKSGDYPRERVAALENYVWGSSKVGPSQEVGGVMVTLAAYCLAYEIDMHAAAEAEYERISTPEMIEKIRAKQAAKPTGSALRIARLRNWKGGTREGFDLRSDNEEPRHGGETPEPEMEISGELSEIGRTREGYTLFVQENGVGGHRYWSDEIGGGVFAWDTSLVSPMTMFACLEHAKALNVGVSFFETRENSDG